MNNPINKKRFFAFGCSMTRYSYATWADLLGIQFEEYYNYGRAGCSNTYIMNKVVEANEVHRFNPDHDFIVVMLTGFGRFSYWPRNSSWRTDGDLYSYNHNTNDPITTEFTKNMWSDNWAVYQSWVAAKTIRSILQSTKVYYKILMSIDNSGYLDGTADIDSHMREKSQDIYNMLDVSIPVEKWRQDNNELDSPYWQDCDRNDGHPSTRVYLKFVEKFMPEFFNDQAIKFVDHWERNFDHSGQQNMETKFINEFRNTYDRAHTNLPSEYNIIKVRLPIFYDCILPTTTIANALQTELGMINYMHGMHTITSKDHGFFEKPLTFGSDNVTHVSNIFEKSFGTWPNTGPGTHLTAGPCMDLVEPVESSLYFGKKKHNRYIYPIKVSPHIDAFSGAAFDGTKLAGNFFWKYISSEAMEDVKSGRAIILLDYGQENFVARSSYENLHIALSYSEIPKEQIVLAFNTFNAEEVYDSWFPKEEQRLIVKSWPFVISNTSYFYMQTREGRTEPEQFYASKNKIRPNHFLFKIRRAREHRQALAYAMNEANLLDLGDWSWLSTEKYKDSTVDEFNSRYNLNLTRQKLQNLYNKLPRSLKDEPADTFDSVSSWTDTQVKSYNNAYFYICTETYTDGPYKSVTEKICKPIANYLPFLFVSFPGALQLLRKMGFKTFDGLIDESYDNEQDTTKRVKMVYEEVKRLCSMNKKQLHNWYWSMEDRLVHNREHLLTLYKKDQKTKDFIYYLGDRIYR